MDDFNVSMMEDAVRVLQRLGAPITVENIWTMLDVQGIAEHFAHKQAVKIVKERMMAVLPCWTTTYEGISIRLEPQGTQYVPQWSRLTTHWSCFRVEGKMVQFPSQSDALAFANTLLMRWAESNKKSWKAIYTQACQELVSSQF